MVDEAFLGYLKQGYRISFRYDEALDGVITRVSKVIGNEVFRNETAVEMMEMELSAFPADDMISQAVRSAALKFEDEISKIKARKVGERDG